MTPQSNEVVLQKAINLAIMDLNVTSWNSQREKVVQLYSQLLVRHGVMLVGPTSGGKTVVRNILQKALYYLPALDKDCDEYELHNKVRGHFFFISVYFMELTNEQVA